MCNGLEGLDEQPVKGWVCVFCGLIVLIPVAAIVTAMWYWGFYGAR